MVTQVKEEYFELNQDTTDISETDIAISTGEGLQIIWEYEVPVGMALIFRNTDHFSAYLENTATTAAEAGASSKVDVVIQDASKQSMRSLLNEVRYAQVKEFQDKDKFCHLDVREGEVVTAEEGERVCIRGNILTATVDASDSYFTLTCHRVRHTLFE